MLTPAISTGSLGLDSREICFPLRRQDTIGAMRLGLGLDQVKLVGQDTIGAMRLGLGLDQVKLVGLFAHDHSTICLQLVFLLLIYEANDRGFHAVKVWVGGSHDHAGAIWERKLERRW